MCPKSWASPSEMSAQAVAELKRAVPSALRGLGRSIASAADGKTRASSVSLPQRCISAAQAPPTQPETQMSSPGRAPARVSPILCGSSPMAVIEIVTGACMSPTLAVRVVSPPSRGQPACRESSVMPLVKPASQASSRTGKPIVRKKARGMAPAAAKSDRFTARAL